MKRPPLWRYVVGVTVALIVANVIAWSAGGQPKLRTMELFSAGFWAGMLAMYIAVHVYRWE